MDLQVYFNCLYSAIVKIDDCITGLELSFLGVDIDLGVLLVDLSDWFLLMFLRKL